jgi:protoporphyrinogen oxidase
MTRIDTKNKIIYCQNGKYYKYNKIISTQPILKLLKQINNVPTNIKKAFRKRFLFSGVRCINIGVKSNRGLPKILKNKHWIYFQENRFSFFQGWHIFKR